MYASDRPSHEDLASASEQPKKRSEQKKKTNKTKKEEKKKPGRIIVGVGAWVIRADRGRVLSFGVVEERPPR